MEVNRNTSREGSSPAIKKPAQANELTIPKHRFDCVNLCLKETKQRLAEQSGELIAVKKRIIDLERTLLDAKIETALARHKAKNLTAVKALIDCSNLKLGQDGNVPGLEEEILRIKESQNYLFESQEKTAYVLVPVRHGDALNKSIATYIKKSEKVQ